MEITQTSEAGLAANQQKSSYWNSNVIVAALGYFVDIYDLLLFGIVRIPSLRDLGVPESEFLTQGVFLINAQMIGMLLGGLLWGVLGDRKGRMSVLFGSIALYSVANLANGFVHNVELYALLRFIAGIGLAGELGAAITLVSETMSKENRGYGTTIVASIGILGAVAAGVVGDLTTWRAAYIIGGLLGLILLALRFSMFESNMFQQTSQKNVARGDLKMLFNSWGRFSKYLKCILIGVPVWFVVGILMTFAPELAKDMGIVESITASKSILFCYAGLSLGDFVSGWMSQIWKTRKKVLALFLMLTLMGTLIYIFIPMPSAVSFYMLCSFCGFATGYWAIFITVAAEQFGTNLRATVTTSVPNFVRAMVVPLTAAFQFLNPAMGLKFSALTVGIVVMIISFVSLFFMSESYGKDLDFVEGDHL